MPSKACKTTPLVYIISRFRSYALLDFQGNAISLAYPDEPYVQKCGNSGKHRFHGLEHDSKMRLFKTYSHTFTLRGYEASGKMLEQKTTNEERKTGKGLQNTTANGGIDRRESDHFPHISEGNGTRGNRKTKTGIVQKEKERNECQPTCSPAVSGGESVIRLSLGK